MSDPALQSIPNFDKLKIIKVGTSTITSSGNTIDWQTIPHGLGFKPIPMAFIDNANVSFGPTPVIVNGALPLPTWTNATIDTGTQQVIFRTYLQIATDATNVTIMLFNSTGATDITTAVKYYLLREASN